MLRRAGLGSAVVALLLSVVAVVPAQAVIPDNPHPPKTMSDTAVDKHLGYRKQTTCSPSAKPGAKALLKLLIDTWGGSSSGISRSCGSGRTSEHKEGRALDWRMNVKNKSQAARVQQALEWMTANNGEVAYRLGIMYIIWDQKIWSLYYAEMGWRKMEDRGSPTQNHKDHVHISLSWDGAMKATSWWTGVPLKTAHNSYWCGRKGKPACPKTIARSVDDIWPTEEMEEIEPPVFKPYPSTIPEIYGSPIVGETLGVVPGIWMEKGSKLRYQWYVTVKKGPGLHNPKFVKIDGATEPEYTLTKADVGKEFKVKVTAISPSGKKTSKTTNETTWAIKEVTEPAG
jgi:hypothetical protein